MVPTSSNSAIVMSSPAVMLTKIPLAPARFTSSNKGLLMASSAAFLARSSPSALPEPTIAIPFSLITVCTSAKSTFIKPGRVINSAIPCTEPDNTSFAVPKAFVIVISPPRTSLSFSLGIVISESTNCFNSVIPSSATSARFLPSNLKGRVTTATVSIFISFATCATTGAAPVPVPPPMPAAIKSISAPSRTAIMLSRSSSAAWRPISGSEPAPKPLVMPHPNCKTGSTPEVLSACASVFAQINSTPSMLLPSICITALPPPPPTPITLIIAG